MKILNSQRHYDSFRDEVRNNCRLRVLKTMNGGVFLVRSSRHCCRSEMSLLGRKQRGLGRTETRCDLPRIFNFRDGAVQPQTERQEAGIETRNNSANCTAESVDSVQSRNAQYGHGQNPRCIFIVVVA